MKTVWIMAAALSLSSCVQYLDAGMPFCPSRSLIAGKGTGNSSPGALCEGVDILSSAVIYPQSYDFRRDSLAGAVDCEVVLYENSSRLLSFPAGPSAEVSPDPDMHHLICGHLYTEYSGPRETVIKKDGKEIFRIQGREYLKGLAERNGSVYTLSRSRDSDAFTLRRDGIVLFTKEHGRVLGGFDDWAYGETGALREDEGFLYFFYAGGTPGNSFAGLVKDGQDYPLKLRSDKCVVEDAMLRNGAVHYIFSISSDYYYFDGEREWGLTPGKQKYSWKSPKIMVSGRGTEVIGPCMPNGKPWGLYDFYENNFTLVGSEGMWAYTDGGDIVTLGCSEEGRLSVGSPQGRYSLPEREVYLFSGSALFHGGHSLFALTPRDAMYKPFIRVDGREYPFRIHGCFTGIGLKQLQ